MLLKKVYWMFDGMILMVERDGEDKDKAWISENIHIIP